MPYPDDEAAATSMADADTFTPDRPVVQQAQTSKGQDGPDDALAAEDEGGADGVGFAPKGVPEAGGGGRQESVAGSAGVYALRSLLMSFKILDWSLFC